MTGVQRDDAVAVPLKGVQAMLGRPGLSPVMIGRSRELDLLAQRFDGLHQSRMPSVVLITGEAGVGKTRLIQELIRRLPPDSLILAGSAREGHHDRAYAVLREAVAGIVTDWNELPVGLNRLALPLRELLGGLLPWEGFGIGDDRAKFPAEWEDLSGVAVELIAYFVRDQRTLIVFEDLHIADAESLGVFERLATEGPPMLLIGTARSEALDRTSKATEVVHRLRRGTAAQHVRVPRLAAEELRELTEAICGMAVSAATTDLLYERTQGSPFFLEELVAGARDVGRDAPVAPFDAQELARATMPTSTSEAILGRLEHLPPDGRQLVRLAAVLGHETTVADLAAVSGKSVETLVVLLRELVNIGVLEETRGDVFAFRHALVREAVLGDLLTQERRDLHRQAFDALRLDEATSTVVLARHAIDAGDSRAASQLTRQAAQTAFQAGAPRTALRMAQDGLEHAPGDPALHRAAAQAAARLGELDAASAHAQAWAEASEQTGDWSSAVDARCHLAWIEWSAGNADGARDQITAAERTASRTHPLATLRLLATRAQLHMLGGDPHGASSCADEVLKRSSQFPDSPVVRHALVTKAVALVDLLADEDPGCMAQPRQLLQQAKQEAIAAGDLDTATRALNNLLQPGIGVVEAGDLPDLLAEAQHLADRHGLERFGTKLAALRAHAAVVEGDRAAAEAALADTRLRHATAMEASFVVTIEVHVAVEGGHSEQAQAALSRHRAQLQHTTGEFALFPAVAEVELATAIGDREVAAAALHRAGEAVRNVGSGAAADWWIAAVLALQAGVDATEVESVAAASELRPVKRHTGAYQQFRGALLAARGETAAAIDALRVAVASPQAGRPRAIVAAARIQLAELLHHAGEIQAAQKQAAQAAEDLARWPGPRRDAVDALRSRLGDGPPGPHDLLTPREREVVDLLVRGFTNGEIAERLYISRKTAASHVSNILAKTQLQRRGQVAAWAVRHGLVDALGGPADDADPTH